MKFDSAGGFGVMRFVSLLHVLRALRVARGFLLVSFTLSLLTAGLFACATRKPVEEPLPTPEGFRAVEWTDVGTFGDTGDFASLKDALAASLKWARAQASLNPSREVSFGPGKIALARIVGSLETLSAVAAASANMQAFEARVREGFVPWKAQAAAEKKLLVTGYYVPVIEGSLVADSKHSVPVYGVPRDLVNASLGDFLDSLAGKTIRGRVDGTKFVPYYSRNDIREHNALDGKADVVAWARNEWDPFVVEVQGSGVLRLPDGSEKLIAYADQNGLGYRAVGKILLDEKKIPREKMSMQAIGSYLADNPDEVRRVLDSNPSFVFFRVSEGRARGSLGFPLTPGRSVAVDMRVFPQGAPALLRTLDPKRNEKGEVVSDGALSRFVFNQDTGGAIRGLARADYFWGQGAVAAEKAGAMQHEGEYFLLLPKGDLTAPTQR